MTKNPNKKRWVYEMVRRGTTTFYPIPYYTYYRFNRSIFNVGGMTDPGFREKYLCLDVSGTFFNMILRGEL